MTRDGNVRPAHSWRRAVGCGRPTSHRRARGGRARARARPRGRARGEEDGERRARDAPGALRLGVRKVPRRARVRRRRRRPVVFVVVARARERRRGRVAAAAARREPVLLAVRVAPAPRRDREADTRGGRARRARRARDRAPAMLPRRRRVRAPGRGLRGEAHADGTPRLRPDRRGQATDARRGVAGHRAVRPRARTGEGRVVRASADARGDDAMFRRDCETRASWRSSPRTTRTFSRSTRRC